MSTCPGGRFSKTRAIAKFPKITRVIYPQNCPIRRCDYLLITPNQKTFFIETSILTAGNYKSASRQLQNNTVNGAMSITLNLVIRMIILCLKIAQVPRCIVSPTEKWDRTFAFCKGDYLSNRKILLRNHKRCFSYLNQGHRSIFHFCMTIFFSTTILFLVYGQIQGIINSILY